MPATRNTLLTIAADGVGVVSSVLGSLLAIAPLTGGRSLGLSHTDVPRVRVLGTADLSLGIAILAGRSSPQRWRAVAARSLLHLVFAREYLRHGRRQHAVSMCALFVTDTAIAIGLREGRGSA